MIITQVIISRFSIPMVPFTIATGTMNFAQNTLIHLHTDAGIVGVGECSAFPMIAGETQETCLVLAKDFAKLVNGKDPLDIKARMQELDYYITGNHTIKSAFDMALYDIASKDAELPLYEYLGGTYDEPESDLTVGIGTPEQMASQAKEFACDSINIKLSKAGGIAEALKIHEVCTRAGIPNMLGGMLESRIALSAKVHLALACPNIKYYDLDTCLLGHLVDPVINGISYEGMKLKVPDLPGIGADADPTFLSSCEQFVI